jgi:hypothetical protein
MAQYIPIRWGSMNRYRREQAEALMQTTGRKAVFGEHLEWKNGDTGGIQPTGMYLADGRGLVLQAVGNPAIVTPGLAGLVYAAKPGKDALALKAHIVRDQVTQSATSCATTPIHCGSTSWLCRCEWK